MFDLSFLRTKEKFLLLEIAPRRTSALLLGLDREKKLSLEGVWDNFYFKELSGNPLRSLRKRKVIVAVDPSFITNVSFPVELQRGVDDFSKPIVLSELENLLSQSIGKVFNQHRGEASAKLGLHELDTVLVDTRVDSFKIDGHLVLNPLGFRGKKVDAVLTLTFTTRKVFEDFKEFFNAKDGFFFTGSVRAALFALSRIQSVPLNLVFIDDGRSSSFSLDKAAWGSIFRREKLDWSMGSLFNAISSAIGAKPGVIMEVYYDYVHREVSEHFHRSLSRVIKPEIDNFVKELKKAKLNGYVYIYSPVQLPFSYPVSRGNLVLEALPIDKALDKFGFKLDFSEWPFDNSEMFMRLAPFFEFYYDKSDSEVSRKLRRRLHWLIQ